MNKGLNYSEKLEAYIRNELTEKEKLELEEQLRQDPLLQNELTLQKDIISSIYDFRKNELKQRLNKIDVSSKSSPGDFTVGGAILGGIAIVGVAGFLIFKDSGNELASSRLSSAVSQMPSSSPTAPETTENIISQHEVNGSTADSNVPETVVADTHANVNKEAKKQTPKKNSTLISTPVVVEANQTIVKEEEILKDDQLTLPESGLTSLTAGAEPTLIIVDNNSTKYKLHYKYTNGQLFLYGFEKPYKIIDLPDQTQRFLLYDGKFYKLNRNQPQIAPIQLVVNQEEKQVLESYK